MGTQRGGGWIALAMTVFGALLLGFGALAQRSAPASALTNCTVADSSLDSEEQQFLTLINQYRAQNGLNALVISTNLNRAAAWLNNDMGTHAAFSHIDSLGRSPYGRALDCGYPSGAGENIAAGTNWSSAQLVMDAWKASPGHNSNMLTSYYLQIGIARQYIAGSPYGWYWTTDFGAVDDGTGGAPAPTSTPTSGPSSPTATRTPTNTPTSPPNTPTPTSTSVPPTPTATPTSPPANTSTPTPTSAASPTATPTAPPTSTPPLTPTATRTPVPEAGAPPKTVPVAAGANLIAWPGNDSAPADALGATGPNVKMVYAWDPGSQTWQRFGPGLPGFLNTLGTLRHGQAYWIIAASGGSFVVK